MRPWILKQTFNLGMPDLYITKLIKLAVTGHFMKKYFWPNSLVLESFLDFLDLTVILWIHEHSTFVHSLPINVLKWLRFWYKKCLIIEFYYLTMLSKIFLSILFINKGT